MATNVNDEEYDRLKEVKQFDESKIGVKGLVDSGITTIPRFFVHPPDVLSQFKPGSKTRPDLVIPTIDLSGVDSHHNRSLVVDQIRQACSSFGFFQIINHGVPLGVLDRMIESIKGFHEERTEIKARFYIRGVGTVGLGPTGVSYISNVDLYNSKAASWRSYPMKYTKVQSIESWPTLPMNHESQLRFSLIQAIGMTCMGRCQS